MNYVSGARGASFNHKFTTNKAVLLYCIFHNHNHVGVATQRAGGLQPPVKDLIDLNKQGTQNNKSNK